MRRAVAVLVPVLMVLGLIGLSPSGTAGTPQAPSRIIVAVTGDADRGFRVERHGGSVRFTPTWSETRTECEEYRRPVAQARCKARERMRYRALAALRDALDHARS